MSWDDGLTQEQKNAASHIGGPARMLAGPGTGKTRVLTRRILFLIQKKKINPQEIVALTFTRFAAYELRKRVSDSLGTFPLPKISTLHSFALRQLVRNSARLDVLPKPLRVADDWEEKNIILKGIKGILSLENVREVSKLFNALSSDWEINNDAEEHFPNPKFIGAWKEHRKTYGYTMRSELVYQLKRSLEQIADFQLEKPIKHLLVDEYQDLNPCDLAIIKIIAERGAELFVAGDDDQSIYGFRHAYPEGIRQFPVEFKGSKDLPLKECKRCDSNILRLGEFVAELDPRRINKGTVPEKGRAPGQVKLLRFTNEGEEAQGIAKIINHLHELEKIPLGEILILLRVDTNGAFAQELINAFSVYDLPYQYNSEDMNPLNQLFGRELLSILRILKDPEDHLAWRTILSVRKNNIGPGILDSIYKAAFEKGLPFAQVLSAISISPQLIPHYGVRIQNEYQEIKTILGKLATLIEHLNNSEDISIDQMLKEITEVVVQNEEARIQVIEQINRSFGKLPISSVDELIEAILELTAEDEPVIDPNKINILTMHKAKGLSSEVVFIVAAEDEHIPGRQNSEPGLGDERRLLFVSLTRAKHKLFISYCKERIGRQKMLGRSSGETLRHLTQFLTDGPIRPDVGIDYINTLEF